MVTIHRVFACPSRQTIEKLVESGVRTDAVGSLLVQVERSANRDAVNRDVVIRAERGIQTRYNLKRDDHGRDDRRGKDHGRDVHRRGDNSIVIQCEELKRPPLVYFPTVASRLTQSCPQQTLRLKRLIQNHTGLQSRRKQHRSS